MGIPVDNTFKVFKFLYNYAHIKRSNVLALTVPETAHKFRSADEKRADLNTRIMTHKADN